MYVVVVKDQNGSTDASCGSMPESSHVSAFGFQGWKLLGLRKIVQQRPQCVVFTGGVHWTQRCGV